ncbi:rhomboid family intramembrane serine protease [Sphaerisporangium krabiense]|uniref:Membrane associated rhomboid family serine protease n=1 Tax=Sphaerisporangium krabiense TaxID=763782 RepID=A0A7W9DTN5_9ACTN|nr:rhomboid family intramembrane serine protease [Sphaerisporangium krabiense]MBB5630801.1 membrane associated rhomboid family serine protease [Sphaerisporangium krabiense]GII65516.1 rhomboid family intramembrane serine protease [Sphaerisporangium krabiense]
MGGDSRTAEIMIAEARKAFWVMVGFLALIWLVQIANWATGYSLSQSFGIAARDPARLPDIVTAPFLHWSWAHIEGNSGPLFVFGFLAAYRGVGKFLGVTAIIAATSGLGVWFVASPHSVTAGASGVVFGYFGYVLVKGLFDRHGIDIVVGLVMALCFAYHFTGLLPTDEFSWQGHLFGFAGGILGGWFFRDRRPRAAAVPPQAATRPVPGAARPVPGVPAGPPPAGRPAAVDPSRAALYKELDDLGL